MFASNVLCASGRCTCMRPGICVRRESYVRPGMMFIPNDQNVDFPSKAAVAEIKTGFNHYIILCFMILIIYPTLGILFIFDQTPNFVCATLKTAVGSNCFPCICSCTMRGGKRQLPVEYSLFKLLLFQSKFTKMKYKIKLIKKTINI